ncbi:hypothetical protein [Bradyrhizobium brasilense]|uniref:hypothetical protein n=1 Tax=Bradyrhizobium brasilense TaxID=1419277 RepID=UPI001FCD6F4D|nr:hypothetical protein [Bradyrhizobium brasilense]
MSTTSACSPPDRATSSPAMMAGFFDFRSSATNASMPAGSGRGERHKLSGARASTAVSCSMTSIGSDTNTGPCGASVATLNARRMIGAISSARSICTLHLVTGAAIATRSWPSSGFFSRIRVSCWPAVTTTGEPAFSAPYSEPMPLPRPGVQVGDRDTPRRLRVEAGGADRDTFMQRHDVFELRKCGQAVEQWRFGRARIAEDMTHAVRHERFHQHTAPAHSLPLDCSDPFCASSAGERPVATVRDGQHPRARLRLPHGFKAQPRQRDHGPATSAAEPAKEKGHRLGGPFAYFLRLAANSFAASALDS